MKTNNSLLLLCVIAIIGIALYSFKPNPTSKKFQYLLVYSEHYDSDKVFVSIDGKEYKKLDLQKQVKGPWDLNPIINLIHQYENDGWELVQLENNAYTSFYMRKSIE